MAEILPPETIQTFTQEEINSVLDYLFAHNREFVDEFLRNLELPFSSSTKELLRERVIGFLDEGKLTLPQLIELLDKIEGWGDQHVYLFNAPQNLTDFWSVRENVLEHLETIELAHLFNHPRPLILPEDPTLTTIEWSPERVRFIWVVKQEGRTRIEAKDRVEGETYWQAWHITTSRGLIAFDWDLITGHAMLMIRKLPAAFEGKYTDVRANFINQLSYIVPIADFTRVRIAPSIKRIEESNIVRRRELNYKTLQQSTVGIKSAAKEEDTQSDETLSQLGSALHSHQISGLLGDFYWLRGEYLTKELHTRIYTADDDDQRINIWGEYSENDIRYVLSCIRRYC